MALTHLNPETLHRSPAFSQGVLAQGSRTVYVGGQNGVNAEGELIDGLGPQTELALRNVLAVLAEAGATQEDVAKLTIHLAAGVDPNEAYAASASVWGQHATAVTVLTVTALGRPGALVEIDAVAVLD